MGSVPFSWMWADPATTLDRIRAMRVKDEEGERRAKEATRKRKARRIRRLTKLAMSGALRG